MGGAVQTDIVEHRERIGLMPGLDLDQCGWETCAPSHRHGPAVRDHVLIHYVAKGKGVFYKGGAVLPVAAGQGFAIFPGEVTTYEADAKRPWEYYWVGFSGPAAAPLLSLAGPTPQRPVFPVAGEPAAVSGCVVDLYTSTLLPGSGALHTLAHLARFLAFVADGAAPQPGAGQSNAAQAGYVARAARIVQDHYADGLTVEQLAARLGIDRTHLYRVFRDTLGMGPQQYILGVRLRQAARLLAETAMTLHQISDYAGFSSPTHFGVAFRRAYGVSPGVYRAGLPGAGAEG